MVPSLRLARLTAGLTILLRNDGRVMRRVGHIRQRWFLVLLVLLSLAPTAPARAQEPSVLALTASGVLGAGNQIELPISSALPVNLRLQADGPATSALALTLLRADGAVVDASRAAGGERLWKPLLFSEGGKVRLRNTGTATLGYQVDAYTIATLADQPLSLSGVAVGGGARAALKLNVAVAGSYDLTMLFSEGSGALLLDQAAILADDSAIASGTSTAAGSAVIQVPLTPGQHTLTISHDAGRPHNVWHVELKLRRPYTPPTIGAVSPSKLDPSRTTTVTVNGQGFDATTRAELIAADGSVTLCPSVVVDATLIIVTVPASLARGGYSLRLSDVLGSTESTGPALLVERNVIFLPVILT